LINDKKGHTSPLIFTHRRDEWLFDVLDGKVRRIHGKYELGGDYFIMVLSPFSG
jgi:hypothetical protein